MAPVEPMVARNAEMSHETLLPTASQTFVQLGMANEAQIWLSDCMTSNALRMKTKRR